MRHLVLLCHRQQCPRTIGHRVSDHQELYISDTLRQSAVDKSGGLNARKWTARLGTGTRMEGSGRGNTEQAALWGFPPGILPMASLVECALQPKFTCACTMRWGKGCAA